MKAIKNNNLPLFHCEFEYIPGGHASQTYLGLRLLEKKGIITCCIKKASRDYNGLIEIKLNNKYRVIIDVLDGYNIIYGGDDEITKLKKFKECFNGKVDYYFKRSYENKMTDFQPEGCIGCNYCAEFDPENFRMSKKDGKSVLLKSVEKKGFYILKNSDNATYENSDRAAKSCPVKIITVKII